MPDITDFLPSNFKTANRSTSSSLKALRRANRILAGKRPGYVPPGATEIDGREIAYHPTKGWRNRRA